MKTSLAHLTEEKQDELKAVVRLTLELFPEGVEEISRRSKMRGFSPLDFGLLFIYIQINDR